MEHYYVKELEKQRGWKPKKINVAVQGFGNAGQHVARLLHSDGYRIVAVRDSRGGIFKRDGFDIPSLIYVKNEARRLKAVYCEGSVCEAIEAEIITNEELLELDIDLLISADLENQITEENAGRIKAPIIVEVANGPVTSEGDRILIDHGKIVIPDILANAGGVTVSYFEWVQNKSGYYWTIEDVRPRLHEIMSREYNAVYAFAEDKKIDMRTAAYAIALTRIGEAIASQGTATFFSGQQV